MPRGFRGGAFSGGAAAVPPPALFRPRPPRARDVTRAPPEVRRGRSVPRPRGSVVAGPPAGGSERGRGGVAVAERPGAGRARAAAPRPHGARRGAVAAMAEAEAGERSLHRLAGTGPEAGPGGLVLRGRSAAAEQHVFKAPAPRASLLGLDVLAAQKRREREEEAAAGGKRSRVCSYRDWEDGRDEAGSPEEDDEEEEEGGRSARSGRKDR